MTLNAKIIITVVSAVVAVAFLLLDSKRNYAGPDWIWRGGRNDLVRKMLFNEDGSFRKNTRPTICVLWALSIVVMWMLAPVK